MLRFQQRFADIPMLTSNVLSILPAGHGSISKAVRTARMASVSASQSPVHEDWRMSEPSWWTSPTSSSPAVAIAGDGAAATVAGDVGDGGPSGGGGGGRGSDESASPMRLAAHRPARTMNRLELSFAVGGLMPCPEGPELPVVLIPSASHKLD